MDEAQEHVEETGQKEQRKIHKPYTFFWLGLLTLMLSFTAFS